MNQGRATTQVSVSCKWVQSDSWMVCTAGTLEGLLLADRALPRQLLPGRLPPPPWRAVLPPRLRAAADPGRLLQGVGDRVTEDAPPHRLPR
jgi:hypothetical protein